MEIIPKNEFYPEGVSDVIIRSYFQLVANEILPFLAKGRIRVIGIVRGKRKEWTTSPFDLLGEKPIFIRTMDDFAFWNTGFCLEFLIEQPQISNMIRIDIDPGEEIPFSFCQLVAGHIYKILSEEYPKAMIFFSGNRAFHVYAERRRALDSSLLKEEIRALLTSKLIEDRSLNPERKIIISKKETSDTINIDLEQMGPGGWLKSPYSIDVRTGLAAIPVPIERLMDFRKEYAKLTSIVREAKRKEAQISREEIIEEVSSFILEIIRETPVAQIEEAMVREMIQEIVGRGELEDIIFEEIKDRARTELRIEIG